MAPVEFEKHIKERMDERRISPSTSAWQKISNRLETRKDAAKPKYWRYAAAALIAGIIASTFWVITDQEPVTNGTEPVVNNPIVDNEEESKSESKTPDANALTVTAEEESNVDEGVNEASGRVEEQIPSAMADAQENDVSPELDEVAIAIDEDPLIDDKVNEVLGQVILMEETKIVVTDAEVDSLLRNAQQELMADRQFRDQYSVDASDLLAGVEEEINKSFRDQVFEKLKQGFVKVRTAVADRNK